MSFKFREQEKNQFSFANLLKKPVVRYGLVAGAIILFLLYVIGTKNGTTSKFSLGKRSSTTVVYIYSGGDGLSGENLQHFIQNGIVADDGNKYYIVLQQGEWEHHARSCVCTLNCPMSGTHCGCKCPSEIKPLPSNAKLVFHENKCFDLGTFGELLEKKIIELSDSEYVIILNSVIRGPFLPPYAPSNYKWTDAFTSKINDVVKLVGPTISCTSDQPFVQSSLIATDRLGLELLRKEGVFNCLDSAAEATQHAEVGGSAAILRNGFSIDSLMLKYQGVDWRLPENYKCNEKMSPNSQYMYDGLSLNPLETVFVEVKAVHAAAQWTSDMQARRYTAWTAADHDVNKNEFSVVKAEMAPKLKANFRKECFDFETYKNSNYDLKVLNWSDEQLLDHYCANGYYEARPGVRLTC